MKRISTILYAVLAVIVGDICMLLGTIGGFSDRPINDDDHLDYDPD